MITHLAHCKARRGERAFELRVQHPLRQRHDAAPSRVTRIHNTIFCRDLHRTVTGWPNMAVCSCHRCIRTINLCEGLRLTVTNWPSTDGGDEPGQRLRGCCARGQIVGATEVGQGSMQQRQCLHVAHALPDCLVQVRICAQPRVEVWRIHLCTTDVSI